MDLSRLQSAATQYPYLRGLFSVPLGLLFILAALGNWQWGPLRHDWVFIAGALAIAATCVGIVRYYDDRYGHVTPSPRQQRKATAAAALGVALMIGLTTLLRSNASWSLDLPVNPIPAAYALLMLVYCTTLVGLRAHHVLIWGALLVAALLPVWDGADPGNIGLVMTGVAVAVNGVLDHVVVVRTLGATTPALDG